MIEQLRYAPHEFAAHMPEPDIGRERMVAELTEDIRKNGLREPITLFEGKVLDGINRQLAALKAGVKLGRGDFVQFEGDREEALAFVASMNMKRRHLTPGQRAEWAARQLVPMFAKLAEERKRAGAEKGRETQAERRSAPNGAQRPEPKPEGVTKEPEKRKPGRPKKAAEQAAKAAGVGTSSVERKLAKQKPKAERERDAREAALARIAKVLGRDHAILDAVRRRSRLTTPRQLAEFAKVKDADMEQVANFVLVGRPLKAAINFRARGLNANSRIADLIHKAISEGAFDSKARYEVEVNGWRVGAELADRKLLK
jgi:hypothetical protein